MKNTIALSTIIVLVMSLLSSCSIGEIADPVEYPVGLSEEEKSHPLAKYYYNVQRPSNERYESLVYNEPENGLRFRDISEMLEDGYLPMENGYTRFKDGSGYVAVNIQFPESKGEMFDWWFDWVGYEVMRYKIWYPGLHSISLFEGYEKPEKYSISESVLKYPEGKICHTVETLMEGDPLQDLSIVFVNPEQFGLDTSRLGKDQWAICANVISGKQTIVQMVHFVRDTKDGVELRSRFWVGNELPKIARKIAIDTESLYDLSHHCLTEYTQLSSFLPEVYQAYGMNK